MWLSSWEDNGGGYDWETRGNGGVLRCSTKLLVSLKLADLTSPLHSHYWNKPTHFTFNLLVKEPRIAQYSKYTVGTTGYLTLLM